MTDTAIREMDWYLRDHLFRQSNSGKSSFVKELLPIEMERLYLRYRDADLERLSQTITLVIEGLVAKEVLKQDGDELKIPGKLVRLQCVKCFYINYLSEAEPRVCLRCEHGELRDFHKKKA